MQIKIYSFLTTLKNDKFKEFEFQLSSTVLENKEDLYKYINQIWFSKTDNPNYLKLLDMVSYLFK